MADIAVSNPSEAMAGESADIDEEDRHEAAAKARIMTIVRDQPDDSSYDEILRELAFDRMIQRGLADLDGGRTLGDLEVRRRLRMWHGGRRG